MTRLYLVRHGETVFNALNKRQGWCDSPLTNKGIAQAKILSRYFRNKGVKWDHAYCSTSERTEDTLRLITRGDMPYERLKGLKEMNFGFREAEENVELPLEEFKVCFKECGGETTDETLERFDKTVRSIMKKDKHDRVLIVAHGGAIMNFMHYYCEKNGEEVPNFLSNCNCIVYDFDGETFKVVEVIRPDFSELD
ncbi:MAG: histidine phosphatase family protein [Erysipelotrichaceae bacterium]|nr:histidine phosphatase family protein [Erysipelotrichaceae bacterium]